MPMNRASSTRITKAEISSLDVTLRSHDLMTKHKKFLMDSVESSEEKTPTRIETLRSLIDVPSTSLGQCTTLEKPKISDSWDNEYEYCIRRRNSFDVLSSSYSRIDRKPIKSCMSVRSLNESLHSSFSSSSKKQLSNVSFRSVEIRKYIPTLGDNPSVSQGPPMTLDWEYDTTDPIPIDRYEDEKGVPRTSYEMVIPRYIREEVLRMHGHSRKEIDETIKEIKKTKKERNDTVQNIKFQQIEYAAERTSRRLKKVFSFQKKNNKKYREQWEAAERQRAIEAMTDEEETTISSEFGEIVICEE